MISLIYSIYIALTQGFINSSRWEVKMTEKAGEHHGQRVSALNKSKIYTQRGRRNDLEIVAASDSLEKPLKLGNEGKRRG